jgi:transcriptional/translational regulatory protein YebC/TACO1
VADEDGMMDAAFMAGADDVATDPPNEDSFSDYEPVHTILTARDDLGAVSAELEKVYGDAKSVNLIWKAQNEIDDPEQAPKVMRLIDALEDCDDVQNVYHSFAMTDAALAALEADGGS